MRKMNMIMSAGLLALVACGGGQKAATGTGLGKGKDVPPPPPVTGGADGGEAADTRKLSDNEKNDYQAALQFFQQTDASGKWNEGACRQSADKFGSVVRAHSALVEAQYMVGLSYQRCMMDGDAEKAYQAAIRMKPSHGQSLSNLGELYFRAGKIDGARQYWESAIKANGKLIAARNNIASLQLEQMRKVGEKSGEWKKLEEEARFNLSNVLGVDSENVKAYTLYGLIYMEGSKRNKDRLALAKLLLDEGKKRNPKYAPLENAYGLYYMQKNALSEALQHFQAAVELDARFQEARMNVGLVTLGFRKYDTAKEQFSKVLEINPKNYDALVGLGAALRGLKDNDGAEAAYKKAIQIDGKRGEAFYNLGVLYKDFRANKQEDLKASIATYRQAKDYFSQFMGKQADDADKAEAKEQMTVIDKTVAGIENFMKQQAAAPPPAPAAPAAPPAKK